MPSYCSTPFYAALLRDVSFLKTLLCATAMGALGLVGTVANAQVLGGAVNTAAPCVTGSVVGSCGTNLAAPNTNTNDTSVVRGTDVLSGPKAKFDTPTNDAQPQAKYLPRELNPLSVTEYQRFVQEATGRDFSLFGYSLFDGGGFPSLSNVPVPTDYVLGPGDEVRLRVWGTVDGDLALLVDRNGQINIPKVGTVNVAGIKASQIESLLRGQISRVYNNFQLSATLGQLRSIQVFVVGQARKPGSYTVSSLSTLISLLFESGGPAANGSMRNIQLKRDGRIITKIDLYKFISEGDKSADAKLQPGDVIVIPPAGSRVALIGALDSPAIYELVAQEEPLGKVLSYGGRTLSLTSPHKVMLERIDTARSKAPRIVEERALDAKGLQSTVRDGDVVTLFKISPEFSNAVTLRGNVAAPLRYAYRPGMRVSDLIPEREALIQSDYYTRRNHLVQYESGNKITSDRVINDIKNLLEEINWDYAAIERMDPIGLRTNLIPFNLSKAVRDKDTLNNVELQPGDVITIFGVNDLPVPMDKRTQFVRVVGEVNVPGIYQLSPGETLDKVVQRAGGFAPNAFVYGSVFTRESTRIQQQKNLDFAIRKFESEIGSQTATSLQNQSVSEKTDTVQKALLAGQRASLERLKSLKATGRVALELDPQTPSFPPIILEDGDQITVPNTPSFIGVFGAVYAEASFLHRHNFTVRDYLDRAGQTRDADENFIFLIRADGSVETDAGRSSSWLSTGSGILGKRLNPGDSIFVPEKVDRRTGYTKFVEGAKDWTTILYQFGLGVAAIKVLKQ